MTGIGDVRRSSVSLALSRKAITLEMSCKMWFHRDNPFRLRLLSVNTTFILYDLWSRQKKSSWNGKYRRSFSFNLVHQIGRRILPTTTTIGPALSFTLRYVVHAAICASSSTKHKHRASWIRQLSPPSIERFYHYEPRQNKLSITQTHTRTHTNRWTYARIHLLTVNLRRAACVCVRITVKQNLTNAHIVLWWWDCAFKSLHPPDSLSVGLVMDNKTPIFRSLCLDFHFRCNAMIDWSIIPTRIQLY